MQLRQPPEMTINMISRSKKIKSLRTWYKHSNSKLDITWSCYNTYIVAVPWGFERFRLNPHVSILRCPLTWRARWITHVMLEELPRAVILQQFYNRAHKKHILQKPLQWVKNTNIHYKDPSHTKDRIRPSTDKIQNWTNSPKDNHWCR
jgi:hypothetical protein